MRGGDRVLVLRRRCEDERDLVFVARGWRGVVSELPLSLFYFSLEIASEAILYIGEDYFLVDCNNPLTSIHPSYHLPILSSPRE